MSSVLSTLVYVHNGLFRAGLIITGFIVIWSAALYLRKHAPSGSYRATLVLTEGLFIVQGLVGIGSAMDRSAFLGDSGQ